MTPILALILALAAPGQAAIRGTVRAEDSLEPLAGATVRIPELGRLVLTDARGYFVLADVPAGRWRVVASALGYREHAVTVVLEDGVVRLDFELALQPVPVPGVEVASRSRPVSMSAPRAPGPAAFRVDVPALEVLPGLAEPDVLRAVQILPSVAAASDFSSALYVRGGSPDQTLITLDGAPLFNPYHLGGVFSAVPFDAVSSVDVMPGALPAGAGDRLSAQVDIRTREGGRDRVRASGTVGLISTHVTASGPLPGGDGALLVAARRTYLDVASAAAHALGLIPIALPYGFGDVYLKATRDVGELGSISVSGYWNGERFSLEDGSSGPFDNAYYSDLGWGSRLAAVSYRQPIGGSLLLRARFAYSDFHGDFDASEVRWSGSLSCTPAGCDTLDVARDSVLVFRGATWARDVLLGADLSWFGRRHTLELGAQLDGYRFAHELELGHDAESPLVPSFGEARRLRTAAVYLEDAWQATNALDLRAGMRFLSAGALGTAWLPRAGARLHLTPQLRVSLGGGLYAQALRGMRDEESALSSLIAYELPTAQPGRAGLARGEDVVVGLEWEPGAVFLRADAFAKRMRGLVLGPEAASALDAPALVTDSFQLGRGRMRGLELLARYRRGRADLTLSYALTFTELRTAQDTFTPRYERRHLLAAAAALPLGETGTFGAQLALGTGQPYTPVVGLTFTFLHDPVTDSWLPGDIEAVMGERNSARLPGYLRLDVAVRKRLERRWFERPVTLTPYFQVLNVLNTRNVLLAEPDAGAFPQPQTRYWPQLPFFPTFGIQWSF